MPTFLLVLYSRKGCCLCEGLENHLKDLALDEISPSLELRVIDIDEDIVPESIRVRYAMEVPVLVLKQAANNNQFLLPRVSPRLKGSALAIWLQGACIKAIERN